MTEREGCTGLDMGEKRDVRIRPTVIKDDRINKWGLLTLTHAKCLRRETKEQVLRITARVWPEHTWNWTEDSKYEVCG